MDRRMKLVRLAERQVARRRSRMALLKHKHEKRERREQTKRMSREIGAQMRAAIIARHEDWDLGPLAPQRALSGKDPTTGLYWGTIGSQRVRLEAGLRPHELEARCAWAGGPKFLCLAVGDRVVITEGPYKHKIAHIKTIHRKAGTVDFEDHIEANMTLPPDVVNPGQRLASPFSMCVPISAIRLVHPLPDPQTGKVRDVIIHELQPCHFNFDRPTRSASWKRLVPGLSVIIPWPLPSRRGDDGDEPAQRTFPGDTLRVAVEDRTFIPTLLSPPMPPSVLDELRSRYSVFRTRHHPDYVARKEAEEAARWARLQSPAAMRTPLQEFHRQQRELRRARGQPVLTDEMLKRTGQIMARNLARRTAGGGGVGGEEARPHGGGQAGGVASQASPAGAEETKSMTTMTEVEKAIESLSISDSVPSPTPSGATLSPTEFESKSPSS